MVSLLPMQSVENSSGEYEISNALRPDFVTIWSHSRGHSTRVGTVTVSVGEVIFTTSTHQTYSRGLDSLVLPHGDLREGRGS